VLNLSVVSKEELETVIAAWGYPRFRADQIWNWIRTNGVTDPDEMTNVPASLREHLLRFAKPSTLDLVAEQRSRDGTIKRAYACADGQVIESVLMPYEDGRYTACISSQAGCAQGCVFCATGQMGFARQLSAAEILEQVARFSAELQREENKEEKVNNGQRKKSRRKKRLSNVVFMGMGEPLANYRNVMEAIHRINTELGIGARKITVSTVGIVPNIRKLMKPDAPQVRLAVSLHCASDKERSALLPANNRYGGLGALMSTLKDYIDVTGRRVTFEWALVEGENDTVQTARQLGRLLTRQYQLRRDMVHVNVIPLNPTARYGGSPSRRQRVNAFVDCLEQEFGIACTPRVRRGIDIDAGCGQLKAAVNNKNQKQQESDALDGAECSSGGGSLFAGELLSPTVQRPPSVGVYEDDEEEMPQLDIVDMDHDDYEDPEFEAGSWEQEEAERLLSLVRGTTINLGEEETSNQR
jgi:23S rRNA (adenine2503-C2)-methyltransferase